MIARFKAMHKISKLCLNLSGLRVEFQRSFQHQALLNGLLKHKTSNIGQASAIESFRSDKEKLASHCLEDEGLFYSISPQIFDRMVSKNFNNKGFPLNFLKLCSAFNENCMMIRKPGLELVNYLLAANTKNAVNRYLLYGKTGCGKTMTLQYGVQHCISQSWLVFPVYYAWDWIRFLHRYKEDKRQELIMSQHNKSRIDQAELSSRWLETFRLMNGPLLDNIVTTKKYVWSKHESSKEGITLRNLVDHGLARPRNATDVIGCLIREIKVQDHTTRPPVLVVVDCLNALFWTTSMKLKFGIVVKPDDLSFVYNLKKLLSNDWTNGAVVTAVDALNIPIVFNHIKALQDIDDNHPYDMIGRECFDLLDPHIPIEVQSFRNKEVLHMLAYFRDRKWIGERCLTKNGEDELIQLSCNNPRELVQLCGELY